MRKKPETLEFGKPRRMIWPRDHISINTVFGAIRDFSRALGTESNFEILQVFYLRVGLTNDTEFDLYKSPNGELKIKNFAWRGPSNCF